MAAVNSGKYERLCFLVGSVKKLWPWPISIELTSGSQLSALYTLHPTTSRIPVEGILERPVRSTGYAKPNTLIVGR